MTQISAHGVSVTVPAGWEAELYTRQSSSQVILHAANFWLPAERGDYGSGAVEAMGHDGIFLALVEFDAASASTQLFAHEGMPLPLASHDFRTDTLQLPLPGHSGCQRFFHVGDRAFCLYVLVGSHSLRFSLIGEVNGILSGLSISRTSQA